MEILKSGDRFVLIRKSENDPTSPIIDCQVDGVSTPFCEVKGSEANQLARWQLISKELEFAEVQLELAISRFKDKKFPIVLDLRDPEGVMIKSLFDSAIIGYIKCFNQTKGRRVKLEVKDLFPLPEYRKQQDHHIAVRELRDSYIAHAGISLNEGSKMIASIDKNSPIGKSKNIVISHSYFTLPSLFFMINTLSLVKFVKEKHFNKMQGKLDIFCKKVIDDPIKYGADKNFT